MKFVTAKLITAELVTTSARIGQAPAIATGPDQLRVLHAKDEG